MKPIYEPKGAAKEYCEWALNIYYIKDSLRKEMGDDTTL